MNGKLTVRKIQIIITFIVTILELLAYSFAIKFVTNELVSLLLWSLILCVFPCTLILTWSED